MKHLYLVVITILFYSSVFAQPDSLVNVLDTVAVNAYNSHSLLHTGAAINYISSADLSRFGNVNMLQALNNTPGVRMEERSPGSYRLNIRGSSVRSPFGVRNVKMYYDGIPITNPDGNTALNLFGFYNIGSVEVIKGPGASAYGAGTGGVVLLKPYAVADSFTVSVGAIAGSFGLKGINGSIGYNDNSLRFEHLESTGYREHAAMRRNVASWDAQVHQSAKNTLTAHFLYSDLYYETPGALTLTEYNNNPKAARPGSSLFPGAIAANASIAQKALLVGFTDRYQLAKHISNTTSLYGFYSQLNNPTIQNYERKVVPHFGGRTVFNYDLQTGSSNFNFIAGAELQQQWAGYKTYSNRNGLPDSLMVDDEVRLSQYFGFLQVGWSYKGFIVTAAGSVNNNRFHFNRFSERPAIAEDKKYNVQLSPRLSVLYSITKTVSAYMNVARGFSPPSTDEVLADNNSYNLSLQPERSWNYEPGLRGAVLHNRVWFDASIFKTGLENAIVTRRDAAGGNYYLNAGKTDQKGLEAVVGYRLLKNASWFYGSKVWASYSHYRFRYKDFVQSGTSYSGNVMPGVASDNLSLAIDINTPTGLSLSATYSLTGKIALNDANTAYAKAYNLLSAKLGYDLRFKRHYKLSVFVGGDNLLNEKYSLGNDINGFNGRYYNAAAGSSYYAGINVKM